MNSRREARQVCWNMHTKEYWKIPRSQTKPNIRRSWTPLKTWMSLSVRLFKKRLMGSMPRMILKVLERYSTSIKYLDFHGTNKPIHTGMLLTPTKCCKSLTTAWMTPRTGSLSLWLNIRECIIKMEWCYFLRGHQVLVKHPLQSLLVTA